MVHPGIIHSGRFTVSEPHAEAGAGLRQQRRPGRLPGADQPDTREGRAALGREAGVSAKPRIRDPPEAGRANAEPHMELEGCTSLQTVGACVEERCPVWRLF